jgi:MFS family permease
MRYAILTFLWAVALVAYVQRSAISVPLQEIGRDLAVQESWFGDATRALGFLQSAWHFGYAFCQIPAGRLADRIGGRRALVLYCVLWSLATAVTGFARSYWEIVAAWTAMGALQAGVFPCAVRSIGQVFGEKERARASGWLGAGMLAGGAIAPVLTAWLLERFGSWAAAENIERWRICLVLYCLPGLVWAAAYWLGTRSAGLDAVASRGAGDSPSSGSRRGPRGGAVPWTDPSLLLLCGQQFLRAAAMIFFVTWFPTFLRETRGVSLLESGKLTSYAGVAAMLGVVCGGYASDWLLARTGSKRIARQGMASVCMASCSGLILLRGRRQRRDRADQPRGLRRLLRRRGRLHGGDRLRRRTGGHGVWRDEHGRRDRGNALSRDGRLARDGDGHVERGAHALCGTDGDRRLAMGAAQPAGHLPQIWCQPPNLAPLP